MSNFQLNPCDACIKAYGIDDINNINQCCSDTYAAFAGVSSINNVRNLESFKNCEECIQKSIKALGRTKCDFRLTSYPVWTQAPHYFPNLFQETNNVEQAKNQCLQMCNKSAYPNECKKNCTIDSMAVVQNTKENFLNNTVSSYKPVTSNPIINKPITNNPIINKPVTSNTIINKPITNNPIINKPITSNPIINKPVTSNPVINKKYNIENQQPTQSIPPTDNTKYNTEFYLSFILGSILFSIIIVLFLKIMLRK